MAFQEFGVVEAVLAVDVLRDAGLAVVPGVALGGGLEGGDDLLPDDARLPAHAGDDAKLAAAFFQRQHLGQLGAERLAAELAGQGENVGQRLLLQRRPTEFDDRPALVHQGVGTGLLGLGQFRFR